ncbi:DUF2637 domain-containing protein [Actinoplanes sp. NPDC051513]|uniref:DUF2637 domain-containing protein n=1 Tax=Actinoplanes sp. NPDC051513 TaxID=3363908 RepID=UPI00379DA9F8
MSATIYALPDLPDPGGSAVSGPSWTHDAWAQIISSFDTIPPIAWVGVLAALTLVTCLTIPWLRSQAFRAGARHGKPLSDEDKRDRRLLIAAMVPASLFWVAVLVGSGRGLVAFGREDLRWTGGWEYLVPLTLDGVAISFALLAFRAVKKNLNPDRAVRIAGLAMCASAGINFLHEVGGSKLGAGYLAILSLLGMLIFDELLGQFELGADNEVRRKNPKFGLRWITWPTNTACAWVAWRNYPPSDDLKATIGNAVTHLETVRQRKTEHRAGQIDTTAWWWRLAPWMHVAALRVALTEHHSTLAAERSATQRAELALAELAETHRREYAAAVEQFRAESEQARSEAAEQIERLKAEHAAHVSRIREKQAPAPGGAPTRASGNTAPASGGAERRLSNDEAVELMLRTHPEPGYEWGNREVNRLTGAGFGRIPKLIDAVREHHARSGGAAGRSTSEDDAKEHSA